MELHLFLKKTFNIHIDGSQCFHAAGIMVLWDTDGPDAFPVPGVLTH